MHPVFISVTGLKCAYSKIYPDPGWKNRDLGNRASSISRIRTYRKFYKGFRGKARSRKLRQPGQTRSCEEAASLAHYLQMGNIFKITFAYPFLQALTLSMN